MNMQGNKGLVFAAVLAAFAVPGAQAHAQGGAYQGHSGTVAPAAPSAPAAPAAPAAPVAPAAGNPAPAPGDGQGQADVPAPAADLPPPDPCAAYTASYRAYAACQDRIQKIERMKDARQKRIDSAKARGARGRDAGNAAPADAQGEEKTEQKQ